MRIHHRQPTSNDVSPPGESTAVVDLPAFPIARYDADAARQRLERLTRAFFNRLERNFEAHDWRKRRIDQLEGASREDLAMQSDRDHRQRVAIYRRQATREMKRKFGRALVAPRHQIIGSAGLGKTRIIIQEYRKRPKLWNRNIAYYAPTIDLCKLFINELNDQPPADMPLGVVFTGRDYKGAYGQSDCARADIIFESQKKVGSVFKSFCDDGKGHRCSFYSGCKYIQKRLDRTPRIIALAHGNLAIPQSGELKSEPPDLVIVDETCMSVIIKQTQLKFADFVNLSTYHGDGASPDDLVEANDHAKCGAYIIDMIMAGPDYLLRIGKDEAERNREAAKNLDSLDVRESRDRAHIANRLRRAAGAASAASAACDVGEIVPNDSDDTVKEKLRNRKVHPGRKVATALRQVGRNYVNWHPGSTTIEVVSESEAGNEGSNGHDGFEPYLLCHGLKELSFKESTSLLVIDADANLEVNNRIFCRGERTRGLSSVSILAKRRGRFTQCDDQTFSTTHLAMTSSPTKEDSPRGSVAGADKRRGKIVDFAKRSAGGRKRAVMTASKRVRLAITKEGSNAKAPLFCAITDNIDINHFGQLKGQNRWRNYDVAIVIGRNQPTPRALERLGRAIYGDDRHVSLNLPGQYVKARRPYGPNMPQSAIIDTHPDPRLRRLLETIREREICQAIDRLRLLDADDRAPEIVVLCKLPLPGIVPDQLLPAAIILAGGTRIELAAAKGFFTTNAAVLAGANPDLWETPKAAEGDLGRMTSKTPKMQEENILYANWGSSISAEFRIRGRGARHWSKFRFDPASYPYPEKLISTALGLPDQAVVECRGSEWAAYIAVRPVRNRARLYFADQEVVSIRRIGEKTPSSAPIVLFFVRPGLSAGRPAVSGPTV